MYELARLPGFLGASEREDILGQLALSHIGNCHVLEHFAQIGAQRDPYLLQALGRTGVLNLLRSLPTNAHQRTLDGTDDVSEIDLSGRPGKPVAPLGATLAADDPRGAQLREDILEERHGDALR